MRRWHGNMLVVAIMGIGAGVAACGSDDQAPVAVASVTVTPANDTVRSGASTQLSATTADADGNPLTGRTITWASSNSSVAMVNNTGLVTGVANGTVNITATSEGVTSAAAVVRSWIGMTGTWSGTVNTGGSICPMTMSLTESAAAAVTGTGALGGPACIVGTYALAGTNDTDAVTDSVVINWTGVSGTTTPITLTGTFDGIDAYTGVMTTGCNGCVIDFTRSDLVPTVRTAVVSGGHTSTPGGILRD